METRRHDLLQFLASYHRSRARKPKATPNHLMNPRLTLVLCFAARLLVLNAAAQTNDFLFIDNGSVRLGVKQTSGAGIAWFSLSGPNQTNLIDHWDRGRLIQQSYYGNEDGSLWDKQPWRWNPVQGGHWRGTGSTTLEIRSSRHALYSKTLPKHWATGENLTNTLMEQWITLTGAVAEVRFKFSYKGQITHARHDQEIPAVFVKPEFKHLVLYDGPKPWTRDKLHRSIPGWPNESRTMTEHWAAYVNDADFGLGVYVPIANRLTCYRFGDGKPELGACSYFAPLTTFAVKPGFTFEYKVHLTIGSLDHIRARFDSLHNASP